MGKNANVKLREAREEEVNPWINSASDGESLFHLMRVTEQTATTGLMKGTIVIMDAWNGSIVA